MSIFAAIAVGAIAALHLTIAWFEIFAWESRAPGIFSTLPSELFASTKPMAANQGLYNGFLAAGLIWSLLIQTAQWQVNIATCFLLFVVAAGIFGAFTVSMRILLVQTVPALIALLLIHLG